MAIVDVDLNLEMKRAHPVLQETHQYRGEVTAEDPAYEQPEKITAQMKPHQLAAVHKALLFEKTGSVQYNIPANAPTVVNGRCKGSFRIRSNIGVLGDIVGYGKTLTALAIIAGNPTDDIHKEQQMISSAYSGSAYTVIERNGRQTIPEDKFIKSTLVIVPHGPVFIQWMEALKQHTSLNALVIDSQAAFRKQLPYEGANASLIRDKLSEYDLVLVKNTMIKKMIQHFDIPYRTENPLDSWGRIMVDEAHDMLNFIPCLDFRFLWMITSTYPVLAHKSSTRSVLTYSIRHLDPELLRYVLIKGNPEFVQRSFVVPAPVERYIECRMPARLRAIQPFLQGDVLDRINANDISGAIRAMGGQNETEDDVLQLVTRNLEREIHNKELAIKYVHDIHIPQDNRDTRLRTLDTELARLKEKMAALVERVTQLKEKSCSICMDTLDTPVILPCTHVMCGACILQWMRMPGSSGGPNKCSVCPECRAPIEAAHLVAVVEEKHKSNNVAVPPIVPRTLDKEETLIKLIHEKPEGRFLVFSRVENTFNRISQRLQDEGINSCEMKGTTATMMRNLERFERGEVRVIMLNTFHAGSGINISTATDVVIFHAMGLDKTQAVGRAQRVGRTSPLTIHNLCYPHELPSDRSDARDLAGPSSSSASSSSASSSSNA